MLRLNKRRYKYGSKNKKMEAKLKYGSILDLVKKNEGINVYKLMKLIEEKLGVKLGYSSVQRYILIMEKDGLVKTKLVPQRMVKRVYSTLNFKE
jgi:DNA-binding PadR family transcriptional regulator